MSFYTDVICKDPRFRSLVVVRDLALLEPVTRAGVQAIIADAALEGITLCVSETYRSQAMQSLDYRRGVTQLAKVGVHHYGLAADFYKMVNGKSTWDGDWKFLCRLAAKHGMVSGGDWGCPGAKPSFRDWDHVQRIRVEDQDQLFAGLWYPGDDYLPRSPDGTAA